MNKFIELNEINGNKLLISLQAIESIIGGLNGETIVCTNSNRFSVEESFEQIRNKSEYAQLYYIGQFR